MITWITHPEYDIPLPPGHRFTSTKFSDLFELLKRSEYINADQLLKRPKWKLTDLGNKILKTSYSLEITDNS